MPTPPSKPIIFISYAPADEPEKPVEGEVKWLSFVTGHLRAAEEIGALEIWAEPLAPGADLGPEARRKLRACAVFAPLVSAHSLAFGAVVGRQNRNYPRAPIQGRGRRSLSASIDADARDGARHRESAAGRRQALFELRRRRARSANAGRGRWDRRNRGGRSGAEEKAADEIAAVATCAGLAGCAAAADRPAAHSGVRDHRTRGLADETSPPGHGRDRGASVVARDGMSCSFCRMGRKRRRPVPGFDRRNPSSDRVGASRREISESRQ